MSEYLITALIWLIVSLIWIPVFFIFRRMAKLKGLWQLKIMKVTCSLGWFVTIPLMILYLIRFITEV